MGKLYDLLNTIIGKVNASVKTVNGVAPDESGNVEVEGGGSSGATAEGAVLYTAQDLTDEQKAQARENIGAGTSDLKIDTTLAVSGAAADARVVGNRFTTVEGRVDSAMFSATLAMPGSVKWDGVIGDKEYVTLSNDGVLLYALVHVSDEIIDPALWGNETFCSFALNGEGVQEASIAELGIETDGVAFLEFAVIVPTDNYSIEGLIFPKKGVYSTAYNALPSGFDLSLMFCSAINVFGNPFSEDAAEDTAEKYFETKTVVAESTIQDTLTWDGNTEGLVCVGVGDETIKLYKVSNSILTAEDMANGMTLTTEAEGEVTGVSIPAEDAASLFSEDGFAFFEVFLVIPYDGYIFDDIAFPESGIYAVAGFTNGVLTARAVSLTVPGYNFAVKTTEESTVIKTEHLPEALRFGETVTTEYSDTLEWDGDTTGLVMLPGGEVYFKVSDVVLSLADFTSGWEAVVTGADGTTETVDSTMVSVKMLDNGAILVFEGVVMASESACLEVGLDISYAGTYFAKFDRAYNSRLSVNGFNGFSETVTVLKPMEEKYLPESVESVIVRSSTEGSTKKFKITVDDTGTLTATEVTE